MCPCIITTQNRIKTQVCMYNEKIVSFNCTSCLSAVKNVFEVDSRFLYLRAVPLKYVYQIFICYNEILCLSWPIYCLHVSQLLKEIKYLGLIPLCVLRPQRNSSLSPQRINSPLKKTSKYKDKSAVFTSPGGKYHSFKIIYTSSWIHARGIHNYSKSQ